MRANSIGKCFAAQWAGEGACLHVGVGIRECFVETSGTALGKTRARAPAPHGLLADVFAPVFKDLFQIRHELVGYCAVDKAVVVA